MEWNEKGEYPFAPFLLSQSGEGHYRPKGGYLMPIRPYEITYIIDPDVTEDDFTALVERYRALAETQGATEIRVDTRTLGRRSLAYAIKHKRVGHYVIMNFMSEPAAPAELERVLKINDAILRAMVVRLDEMPPEPAPIPEPVIAETPAEEPLEETPESIEEPVTDETVTDTEPVEETAPETDEPAETETA